MKRIFYTLFTIIVFASGCSDDFLNQTAPDQLTTENFWRNKADAEAALASVYSQIEHTTSYWGYGEVKYVIDNYRSDLCLPGSDAANYPDWIQISTFSVTPANTQTALYWSSNYRGIYHANQVIEKVGEMTKEQISDADKNQIIAEAKFLRAFYNFKLILNWKKIILRKTLILGEESIDQGLAERSEVWDFIIQDLQEAIPHLASKASQASNNAGRATQETAQAYLGKAFLFRAGEESSNASEYYQKAVDALAPLVANRSYSLSPDFRSLFDGTNQNSDESLFEIQFTSSTDNGGFYKFPKTRWLAVAELHGWDEIRGTQTLLNEMQSETKADGTFDDRLYGTLLFSGDASVNFWGYTYDEIFTTEQKIAFTKYLPPSEDDFFADYSSAINEHLLRFSDVLLMYAEALNEIGRTAEAIPLINEVRTRANMPVMAGSSQSEVKDQIVHERLMEFAMEGYRFFDLRRWGLLEDKMRNSGKPGAENFNLDEDSFFPIPEKELYSNNGLN